MTDRPILFSSPMVQAILREIRNPGAGKTQTRRVLKIRGHKSFSEFGPSDTRGYDWHFRDSEMRWHDMRHEELLDRLSYQTGDRLWMRETWNAFDFSQDGDEAWPCKKIPTLEEIEEIRDQGYRVSPPQAVHRESDRARKWFADQKWRPGIHMPRWASRITLDVTDVRVQRLQEIDERDAKAEGYEQEIYATHASCWFRSLWDSLNADRGFGWSDNPWVVAVTFRPHLRNINQMEKAA